MSSFDLAPNNYLQVFISCVLYSYHFMLQTSIISTPEELKLQYIRPLTPHIANSIHIQHMIAPPYDVVDRAQAYHLAMQSPKNFLHITRADADLEASITEYHPQVYALAKQQYQSFIEQQWLQITTQPTYYIYQIETASHVQTGFFARVHLSAYHDGALKRHELTRPIKENDRMSHIVALNAQMSPALFSYLPDKALAMFLQEVMAQVPLLLQAQLHEETHRIWDIPPHLNEKMQKHMDELGALYIADGHHRVAAAARVAAQHSTVEAAQYVFAGLFPSDELQILGYHRLVKDLNGLSVWEWMQVCEEWFSIEVAAQPVQPTDPLEVGMYVAGQWYRLKYTHAVDDLVTSIPSERLTHEILTPLLDIVDLRTDPRIEFVGGMQALQQCATKIDNQDAAVAFILPPVTFAQMQQVADLRQVMPPKSTWLEPKLADGLLVYPF